MARRTGFKSYRPRTILNKHKRPDHWFWTRYTAHPYKGCQHGCEFYYCHEKKCAPHDDPNDFAYVIQVKENAPDLLRRALSRAQVDLLGTGDYQPAERRYGLSRRMLDIIGRACKHTAFNPSLTSRLGAKNPQTRVRKCCERFAGSITAEALLEHVPILSTQV